MYHIFISHAWDYNTQYNTLIQWINDDNSLLYANYSVPMEKPIDTNIKRELKQKLTEKIARSNVVIIISGMYATYSEWIDYEIDEAVRMRKYIIGVRPWGQERIPVKIQNNANIMVGWNSSSVINAIKNS